MPQKTQTISVAGYDPGTITALAYGALESLGWTIKYAVEKQIIAYTPRKWNKYDHEITIETADQQLTITSKHIHGELADLPGRNKKFIEQFLNSFDSTRSAATEAQVSAWKERTSSLRHETIKIAEEEIKQAAEVDTVMNLSKSNLYVTYGIMAINALVFILMCISGVSLLTPSGIDIIKWGGNHALFTLSGDWWRLVTCVFVHIGIIHLLFNMYALYMIGIYLEPMLGKGRFIAAYLGTGICASVASLWWHETPIASAGASGAIFGMYGVFLALLSTKLIPKQVRDQLLKSIGIFIVYNLVYGMKSGVDNAAHVGGLLSGLIIGYVFYAGWKGDNAGKRKTVLAILVVLASMAAAYFYLEGNKVSMEERGQISAVIKSIEYSDGEKMLEKMRDFVEMETKALAPFNDETLTPEERIKKLEEVSLPEWEKATNVFAKMKRYDVSAEDKKKIDLLAEYIHLRIEEIGLIKKYYSEMSPGNKSLVEENTGKIEGLIKQLEELQ